MSLDSVAELHLTGILTGIRECGEMEKWKSLSRIRLFVASRAVTR